MHDPAVDAYVTLNGLSFHYREYAGPGRPFVLLHGLASNSRWWLLVAPLLAQRFRVLALDQRGHGESDKPDSGYDFTTIAADLAAFIDALELERPIIVGHSWGSEVALQYAASYPERPAGVVLTEGGYLDISARPGMTWERAEQQMAPPDLTRVKPQDLIERAKRWELGSVWSDEVEAALMGNFALAEDGTLRPHFERANHMQVVRAYWEQRPSELCSSVRCPVLVIAAEREGGEGTQEWMALKREAIERIQTRLDECDVLWFPNSIHDLPLQRPQELAQAIEAFALSREG